MKIDTILLQFQMYKHAGSRPFVLTAAVHVLSKPYVSKAALPTNGMSCVTFPIYSSRSPSTPQFMQLNSFSKNCLCVFSFF